MIPPSDVVARTQVSNELAYRPVAQAGQLTDKLSDFSVGQRMMAQIQALLPNGTYRAVVAQREIVLSLPFLAKSGDALELVVTESRGKLALAVLAHHEEGEEGAKGGSAPTNLSKTGQFITAIMREGGRQGGAGGGNAGFSSGSALPMNNSQPILNAAPKNAQDIVPQLRLALAQSGMFYEAHQAQWIAGKLPLAALLQEPQGKLSGRLLGQTAQANEKNPSAKATLAANTPSAASSLSPPLFAAQTGVNPQTGQTQINAPSGLLERIINALLPGLFGKTAEATPLPQTAQPLPTGTPANAQEAAKTAATSTQTASTDEAALTPKTETLLNAMLAKTPAAQGQTQGQTQAQMQAAQAQLSQTSSSAALAKMPDFIAPQTQAIVQQQLTALAGQPFVWHGQIWPGQEMTWEIEEEEKGQKNPETGEEEAGTWKTNLRLFLPHLGGVEVKISLKNKEVALHIDAGKLESMHEMRKESASLKESLDEVGLSLTNLAVYADINRLAEENAPL